MHLDYRCFIKVSDPSILNDVLKKIELEAIDGNVYSLEEISEVFSDINQIMRMTQEPIGDIFDTVAVDKNIGLCFIHDHRKSFEFFKGLTEYIYESFSDCIGDKFVIVADVTNYDDDSFGNCIFYYLGDGNSIKMLEIDGPDGLVMHEENEISELLHILKDHNLSEIENENADKYYVKLANLMEYNFNFLAAEFDEDFDDEV